MPIAKPPEKRSKPIREISNLTENNSLDMSQKSSGSTPRFNESPQVNGFISENPQDCGSGINHRSGRRDDFVENADVYPGHHRTSPQPQESQTDSQPSHHPPHSLRGRFSRFRKLCGALVDDDRTQIFILFLVMVNSILFGLATFPFIKDYPHRKRVFDLIDTAFLMVYSVEMLMQLIYQGKRFIKNGWLVFDLTIVVVAWMTFPIVNDVRIFRAFRLVTRVDMLRNVVVALFSIIPQITAIFFLLLLIFYVFAVMFTQLFKNMYSQGFTENDYFGRMDYTLFTLFQILCLDEWSAVAYEVMAVYPWACTIFISFIVMSAFVVVNLIIAVICDAVNVLRNAEKAMLMGGSFDESAGLNSARGGMPNEQLQHKINEMQQMLDDLVEAQKDMAKTIEYLSLALLPGEIIDRPQSSKRRNR